MNVNQGKKKDPKTKSNKAVKTKKPVEKKPAEKPAKATTTDEKSTSVKNTPAPVKPKAENVVTPVKTTPKAKNIKIDDNSLVKLLEALAIRAKFGGEAEQKYNQIIELLVK